MLGTSLGVIFLFYNGTPGFFRNYNEVHPSSSTSLPLCFFARRRSSTPPATEEGRRPPPASPTAPRGTPATSWPHSPRTGPLLPSPRHPSELRGRHLDVAVASSMQCPGPPSRTRPSTRRTPASLSPHFLSSSPPKHPRTSPSSTRTPTSSGSPATRHSRPPSPTQTLPLAPPHPRAARRPLLVAQNPPEHPRRRSPCSDRRCSPSTTHLRPPPPRPRPTSR